MNEEDQLAALQARLQAKEQSIAQLEAMPDVAISPTPELSWWQRGQQLAATTPTSIGGYTPEEYAKLWTPSGIAQNLRMIPEEGASVGASIIGARTGTVLGGPLGGILGGALGSYADVPIQMGIDYLTGATPSESRLSQATKEAGLGAGIETALTGAGALGRFVAPAARATTKAVGSFLGPSTEEAAQRLVGSELVKSITRDELIQAAAEKEALGSIGQTLTTADLTGSEQLSRMQELLSRQPAGNANVKFAKTASKQLQALDDAALNMTALQDPNPKRAGEAARELLEKAKETQNASASAKFTDDLREIGAPSTGLRKAATEEVDRIYKGSDVLGPSGELENLVTKIKDLDAPPTKQKSPVGFGRQATEPTAKTTETTVGTLQDLRSQALELSRSATPGSRDELLADRLSEMLAKRIDNVPGTERLKDAQRSWREYKQRWFRGEDGQLSPLAKLLRKQNPEDIIKSVSQKSAVSDEYARVLGGLEPNKLATEMADFVQKDTVAAKLKWLRSKRAVYADSPIAPVLQEWEDALTKIQATEQSGKIPGLSAQNIDTQATSLIRALGGTKREAVASAAEAGTFSALRNIGRSGITSALGGKLAGVVAGVGERVASGVIQESTARTASALAEALSDPATALKYIDDAAKFGSERAAKIALQDKRIDEAMSLVESLAPGAAALTRGAGLFTPELKYAELLAAPTPTTIEDIQAQKAQIKAELDALVAVQANPTPTNTPTATPQSTSVEIGKQKGKAKPTQEINAMLDEIPREYGINPKWVKAMAYVESRFNPEAVSPKGAQGLLQLMPATAKALNVKNSFDPKQNIEGASKLLVELSDAYGKYKDKRIVFAAYNSRPSKVNAAISKARKAGDSITWENIAKYMPTETQNYVRDVINLIEA